LVPLASLFDLGQGSPRYSDELGYLTAASDGFCGIAAVLERVLVANGGAASGRATMHPTPALSAHCRGLA